MEAQYRVKDQRNIETIELLEKQLKHQQDMMDWLLKVLRDQIKFPPGSEYNVGTGAYTASASDLGG